MGRNCNFVYLKAYGTTNPSYGTYIQATDGKCYTKDEWSKVSGLTPNGIAVVSETNSFVVSLKVVNESQISTDPYNIPGALITEYQTIDLASSDFKAKSNTEALINAYGNSNTIQGNCNNYTFPNGKKGYMPALGQAHLMVMNGYEIGQLIKVALSSSSASTITTCYSSTFYGENAEYGGMYMNWAYGTTNEFYCSPINQPIWSCRPITDF